MSRAVLPALCQAAAAQRNVSQKSHDKTAAQTRHVQQSKCLWLPRGGCWESVTWDTRSDHFRDGAMNRNLPHEGTWETLNFSCPLSPVSFSEQGLRVPFLSDKWRRYVFHICENAAEKLPGLAVQPNLPLLLHQPIHIHDSEPLHCAHHRHV